MTKSFTCSDAGVNCNWTASSENEEDLLNKKSRSMPELFIVSKKYLLNI
jgi:predicted small metal-binding protein